jgi:hypothetical protein
MSESQNIAQKTQRVEDVDEDESSANYSSKPKGPGSSDKHEVLRRRIAESL